MHWIDKNCQRHSCSAFNCLSTGINILAGGRVPLPPEILPPSDLPCPVNGILWEMWELINTLRKYFAVHWLPYITGHWNCCHVIHTRLNWLPKQSFPASTGTWLPIGNRAYKGLSAFVKSLVARTRRCGEYRQVKFIWFRWTRVARFIPSRISPTALASLVRPTVQYTVQRHSACHFWQGNYLDCA